MIKYGNQVKVIVYVEKDLFQEIEKKRTLDNGYQIKRSPFLKACIKNGLRNVP